MVSRGVDHALDCIEAAFFSRPLVALSSLAEGADRLAAHRLLARSGAALVAVLPLPEDLYRADFQGLGSHEEFNDLLARAAQIAVVTGVSEREEAYGAAGRLILDRSHALLAIWDGRAAKGTGGTGWVVAEAHRRGMPLAWVHAANSRHGSEQPASLGDEQGSVTFECFPNLPRSQ